MEHIGTCIKEDTRMIQHMITEGISTVYKKETTSTEAYPSSDTGTLDYLVSTPAILMMVIDSATEMLDKLLPKGYITVGKRVELHHEHPSLIGETISLKLTVEKVDEKSVTLDLQAADSKGVVCTGKVERAVINKDKLLEIAYKRIPETI